MCETKKERKKGWKEGRIDGWEKRRWMEEVKKKERKKDGWMDG